MCYSFESSIRTSAMSLVSILILLKSNIKNFKFLAFTLIGWCAMQFTEGLLWLTEPRKECSNINKFLTMVFIPATLIMQPLGSVYGYHYVNNFKLNSNEKIISTIFSLFVIVLMIGWLNKPYNYSNCTVVTNSGHLYWSGKYPGDAWNLKMLPYVDAVLALIIILPILSYFGFNKKNLKESILTYILLFSIPLYGIYKGLRSDSNASVWCNITSYSSLWFVFLYMLEKHMNIKLIN